MNPLHWLPQSSYPRRQAERMVRIITQPGFGFHGALLGKRREGKTDLLRQVHALLFRKAEGPIPFFYAFPAGGEPAVLAGNFFAAFCQQVRAFLMRQEDLLWEPAATLERELERAGLPLSLTELARNFLALPSARQLEFAASLPAQFAHREGRPLAVLFDDAQALDPASPFFPALDSPYLRWLLAGRYPLISRIAAKAAWPLVRLEPFSREESLALAQQNCAAAGVRFSRQVWEQWCEMAGTPCWLISTLIEAAAIQEQSLDSAEELGRLYIRELASGTLGNWLTGRFEQAVPDRRDRAMVAEFLVSVAQAGVLQAPASSLAPQLWDGLVAEEWAEGAVMGLRIGLDMLERDWLSLVTASAGEPPERAQARMFQAFLLRAEQSLEQLRARLEHGGTTRINPESSRQA